MALQSEGERDQGIRDTALLHDQLGSNSFMQMIMIMPFD